MIMGVKREGCTYAAQNPSARNGEAQPIIPMLRDLVGDFVMSSFDYL